MLAVSCSAANAAPIDSSTELVELVLLPPLCNPFTARPIALTAFVVGDTLSCDPTGLPRRSRSDAPPGLPAARFLRPSCELSSHCESVPEPRSDMDGLTGGKVFGFARGVSHADSPPSLRFFFRSLMRRALLFRGDLRFFVGGLAATTGDGATGRNSSGPAVVTSATLLSRGLLESQPPWSLCGFLPLSRLVCLVSRLGRSLRIRPTLPRV